MDPTASSSHILPPGSRLQNFRIVKLLGRGGFGAIYLANDISLGHRVAIKEYLPGDISSRAKDSRVIPNHTDHEQLYQWGLDRFVKEARNLVRFRHPNIVRVSALFQENNTAYMVMDFEEGVSLRQFVSVPENRTEEQLKALIKPIAQGLSEVHRQGFIHRDIKPGNLLVRNDGSPVLLDFGSARLASRHATHGLTALVSSGYAPLEQYNPESEEQQGPWSDIYALGGVLYHSVTQKDPADSTQRSLSIVNGQKDPMPTAEELGAGNYSVAFLRAIDWALSVRIADRPQMLGDWIPALFATNVPPDASETTQRFLDQQTRIATSSSKVVSNKKLSDVMGKNTDAQPQVNAAADSQTHIEQDNWDKAMAAAEQRDADDPLPTDATMAIPSDAQPVARRRRSTGATATQSASSRHHKTSGKKHSKASGLITLVLIAGLGVAGWFGYDALKGQFATQQAAVDAQKRAADEALAKAEAARQEALAAVSEQRRRDEERERLGLERQNAAEAAAKLAQEEREAKAARDEAAAKQLAADKKAKEAASAKRARDLAALRLQQNTLLDEAKAAIDNNDFSTAQQRLAQAENIKNKNPRIQTLNNALAAAEANAREPISDQEFNLILGEFHQLKEAIENGNKVAIYRLTNGGEQAELFSRLIDGFERIEMSITAIRARDVDKSIVGTLRIDRMIRDNGNRATPSQSYQDRTISSKRTNGVWSDILW